MIFLDQHKAYYALDRDICLQILEVYGVGTQALHLLQRYWVFLTIVSRSGGYYGAPFKGYRGVTKGGALSPTIFNLVVYAVVQHWFLLVVDGEEVMESWGR